MLRVEGLEVVAGEFRLRGVDLTIPAGTYGVLLGPTGSGKSVFIETVCGLRPAASGRIRVGDRDVTRLDPRDRGVGYVPQDYVLFPTKRVLDNITLGLRARGASRVEAAAGVGPLVEMLGIVHLLERWPATLSGGEQQRVALARALAVRPVLLLLDEPVSALDEAAREAVCTELKRIQRETGTTTLHVCHNLEEARLLADSLAVMRDGRLVQAGPPDEVFARPADAEMARFLRTGSVLAAVAEPEGPGCRLRLAGREVRAAGSARGEVLAVIPAEQVSLSAARPEPDPGNLLEAEVRAAWPRGPVTRVDAAIAPGVEIQALLPGSREVPPPGSRVWLSFPASAVHVLKMGLKMGSDPISGLPSD